jgi:hypothetical protein
MTFDRESIEEQIALNMIEPIQRLAWDALLAQAMHADPFPRLREIESLWMRVIGACSTEMTALGILDDEVSIARNRG